MTERQMHDEDSIQGRVMEFLQYLDRSSEYSVHTVKAYTTDLGQFLEYVHEQMPETGVDAIEASDIQKYKETMADLKPATVSRKLSAISAFFDWLWLRGQVESNPVDPVKRPRQRHRETKWVTAEDTVALMAACRDDRERAILATYVRAALRYSELTDLKLSDVDLVRDELSILGKGDVRRTVPILSDLRPYLVRWLAARPDVDHDYVFTTRTGHRLYRKACWRLFRSLLRRAGLEEKGYTVHSLRHGAATQMYEAGVDTATIARFLRHSDMTTVGRYVHASTKAVRQEVEEKLCANGDLRSAVQAEDRKATLQELVKTAVAEVMLELTADGNFGL